MKTKILIIVLAGLLTGIWNPAVAQHLSSDSLSGSQELYPPITIPWHHFSIFETDVSGLMEESTLYDFLPVESAPFGKPEDLENRRDDDHCEEVKTEYSSTCATDYEFINNPVTIQ